MLVAQLGPAAMQFFQGRKQKREGDAMAKNIVDPKFDIPDSAEAALANAERNASSRYMPGQTNLQTQLNQGTANTTSDVLRTARSPQDVLAALTSIHATNQKGQNEIGFQAAQNFNQRQADLRGQQGIMSGWENKRWENDVLNKFLRDSSAASALKNAGIRNKYEGAKAGFNALGSVAGSVGGLRLGTGGAEGAMPSMADIEQPAPSEIQQPSFATPDFNTNMGGVNTGNMTPQMIQSLMQFLQSGGNTQYNPSF